MRVNGLLVMGAVATAVVVAACSSGDEAQALADDVIGTNADALVGGASRSDIAVGAAVFLNGFPATHDNGRACATCHVPGDHFQLTPAHVQQAWSDLQAKLATDPDADDPIFRDVDANGPIPGTPPGTPFDKYRNLKAGLVRVRLKLPDNVAVLVGPPGSPVSPDRYVDVWRAVPTIENVGLSRPAVSATPFPGPLGANLQPGFQQDARIGTLEAQALAALHDHSEVAPENDPKAKFIDAVAGFQKNVFSSDRVAAFAAALEKGEPAPNPEPELDALETQGKAVFQRACSTCHGGNSQTERTQGVPFNFHNIGISKPMPASVPNVQGQLVDISDIQNKFGAPSVPLPPKFFATYTDASRTTCVPGAGPNGCDVRPSNDPGRYLTSGALADFNTFDIPQLRGIANTAPYFHDNSAKTLEDVLNVYDSFFILAGRVNPNGPAVKTSPGPAGQLRAVKPEEKPALLAYLRKI